MHPRSFRAPPNVKSWLRVWANATKNYHAVSAGGRLGWRNMQHKTLDGGLENNMIIIIRNLYSAQIQAKLESEALV